jgi:hypothetical protein
MNDLLVMTASYPAAYSGGTASDGETEGCCGSLRGLDHT